MEYTALFWLICNLLSIGVLAFYSMQEMAFVSFNKVRLQYYVSKGMTRALWINYLLQNSSRLFGVTLIGVNIALVIGSECSRLFHSALGINPDLAPITQVFLVVIFGELAPMFAARHYAESVAMSGVPIIYASAKLMAPILWAIERVTKAFTFIVSGREVDQNIYLNQEELLKILEEQEEETFPDNESEEFNAISTNIFNLRSQEAKQIMEPLNNIPSLPSNATIANVEGLLKQKEVDYVLIYHQHHHNIVGIALPRDLLRAPDIKRVRDYARAPWFVTEHTPVMQILKQFRHNNENLAVILNHHGHALGVLTLDDVLEEIFGKSSLRANMNSEKYQQISIEKTFPGDMLVGEFNRQYDVILDKEENLSLSELITRNLGRLPERGESVYIPPFELTVKETTLLDVKSVMITTRIK